VSNYLSKKNFTEFAFRSQSSKKEKAYISVDGPQMLACRYQSTITGSELENMKRGWVQIARFQGKVAQTGRMQRPKRPTILASPSR
jgi:hypothetical protein